MRTLKALDLFCGTGSVSIGLRNGGFQRTVGVDSNPECEKYYPFKAFKCGSVFDLDIAYLQTFDFIWASPPCQAHTALLKGRDHNHEDLIPQTRKMLLQAGVPFVIENVPGAFNAMRADLLLCGSMFNLGVIRHRIFESTIPLRTYFKCNCRNKRVVKYPYQYDLDNKNCVLTLTGHEWGSTRLWATALGENDPKRFIIPKRFLAQAIPPIYAQHIAEQAVRYIYFKEQL